MFKILSTKYNKKECFVEVISCNEFRSSENLVLTEIERPKAKKCQVVIG